MIHSGERNAPLAGKVALVTGGASGIGRATAIAFGRAGARVVVSTGSDIAGAEATVRGITKGGGDASFVQANVSLSTDVQRLIKETVRLYGRLDCAVNNAGITGPTLPTADLDDDDWDGITGVNLKGVFLCLKYEIRQMLSQGDGGAIVNLSSVAGLVGSRINSAYCASKHGVVGLSKKAAIDYASVGIRVNAVCPGLIQTPMVDRLHGGDPARIAAMTALEPVGRFGTPEEAAAAIVWLCLPES